MRDNRQQGGMSTRVTRMKMKTARMRRTRMRTRGEETTRTRRTRDGNKDAGQGRGQ